MRSGGNELKDIVPHPESGTLNVPVGKVAMRIFKWFPDSLTQSWRFEKSMAKVYNGDLVSSIRGGNQHHVASMKVGMYYSFIMNTIQR